jgi:amino acid transporter
MSENDHPAKEHLGPKRLSLPDVVAQSVGFMGPVFSAAFVIPLVVGVVSATGKGGGVASPVSVLIAAVGIFAIGWIVAGYAKRIHSAGSLYDYVKQGLGERIGAGAGWLYYGGVLGLLLGLVLLVGGYVQSTLQSEFKIDPAPSWAWSLVVIAIIAAVMYFGVSLSTRAQLGLALVSMIVVLAFFIEVIVKLGSTNSLKPFSPSSASQGWAGIFFGVLYGVLLFVGFETAANLAEETKNPKREIPIAVLLTAGIATVFFGLAAYVQVAGFHYNLKEITAAAGAPLFALGAPASAGGYGGTWINRLLELVVLFDMIAVIIGCSVAASRGMFVMARDRRLPKSLALVSNRNGAPIGAGAVVVGLSLVAVLVNQNWTGLFALPNTPHYFALFSWGSTFGGFALVFVYLLMSAGALRESIAAGGAIGQRVAAVIGIVVAGGAVFASFYKVTSPTILAPGLAVVLFGAGLLSTEFFQGRKAGALDLELGPREQARQRLATLDAEGRFLDVALLVMRLVLGWVFVYHGAGKLFGALGGYGMAGTGRYFDSLGLHPGIFFALVAGCIEFFGGIAMIFGLGSRIWGLLQLGDMVMAILSTNWYNGLISEKAAGGYEIDLALGALALSVFLLGPGRFSLDRFLGVERTLGLDRWDSRVARTAGPRAVAVPVAAEVSSLGSGPGTAAAAGDSVTG